MTGGESTRGAGAAKTAGTGGRGLSATIRAERGSFRIDLDLEVPPSTVTAIVGPNGSGKSTALRTLAGLLRPREGRIVVAGSVFDDVARGIHTPPAQRNIGVVFQDYLLFPHLTALDNVAFGLITRGHSRRAARARAEKWLERLGIPELSGSRPRRLSGGEAQRVALGRALALEPPLLLLDEPLAALDSSTTAGVRELLATELRAFGGSTILVTHDPADALALADELLVLDRGRIVQSGTPRAVRANPGSDYVRGLLVAHSPESPSLGP